MKYRLLVEREQPAGFFGRIAAAWTAFRELRQSPENPSTPLSAPADWLFDTLGGAPTASGARINERTAIQISAIYACVRVIAESIGSLPLHTYRPIEPNGREKAYAQREYRLLHDAPNERMTACVFREVLTTHVLLWGNAYALVEFDGSGKTKALWPLMPWLVAPQLRPDRSLEYLITDTISTEQVVYPASEIIHIPGLSFDGVTGISPIKTHREGIGLAQALERFGAEYFGNGTAPSGVLTMTNTLSPEAKTRLSNSWKEFHTGQGNRHKVPVLEEGMEFKPLTLQADHAQFIESRKFQINEIARIFRVPLHMIGDLERATFSNIEHQSLEFVEHTLRPWLVRWEQELNRKLFPRGDHFVEHNIDGLLRGDFKSRMDGYATGRNWGWWSVNEIRVKEGMNPLPGDKGDIYLTPANMLEAGKPPKPPVVPPMAGEEELPPKESIQ